MAVRKARNDEEDEQLRNLASGQSQKRIDSIKKNLPTQIGNPHLLDQSAFETAQSQ